MSSRREATQTGGREATEGHIAGDVALAVGRPTDPPPDGFEWRPLTEVARLETGHTPSRKVSEYWEGGILPWIGIRDATANHGREITTTNEYITELGEQNSSTRLLPEGTVCLSRTASVGYVVVMGRPMCTSQDFVNWVCGPELDSRYLKYILMAERGSFLRFAHGTTHQTIYFPEVKAFHALLPPIAEQRAIAGVLGALDDKIESNRRRSSISAELIRSMYQFYCETPEQIVLLSELADFQKGVSYRSADLQDSSTAMVTLKSFDRNGGYKADGLKAYVGPFKPAQVMQPGELAVAQTDLTQGAEVVGRVIRAPRETGFETLVASLDLIIVRPAEGIRNEYLFGLLSTEDFRRHCQSRTSGTTVLHLASDALPTYEASVPSVHAQSQFADAADPLLKDIDAAESENRTLVSLRDALLPELLSGRLRVRDAESLLEDEL